MKLGCLDYNFNFLPFPASAAKLGTYSFMALARLGFIKRYRYATRALQEISQLGFEGVQVMCEDVGHMPLKPSQLEELSYDLNLEITSLGGYTDFFDKSKMQRFRNVIDYAAEAGTKIVCTHSGKGNNKKIMSKNLANAVEYAASRGIIIALENSPLHSVSTITDVLQLLKEVPSLRLNFDPANFNLANVDAIVAAKKLGRYFVHVHAKDSIKPFSFPPIGKGEVPWPHLLQELKTFYDGYLVVEFEGHGDPLAATIHDKAYLERELKKL